jgi:hypothetical protein
MRQPTSVGRLVLIPFYVSSRPTIGAISMRYGWWRRPTPACASYSKHRSEKATVVDEGALGSKMPTPSNPSWAAFLGHRLSNCAGLAPSAARSVTLFL